MGEQPPEPNQPLEPLQPLEPGAPRSEEPAPAAPAPPELIPEPPASTPPPPPPDAPQYEPPPTPAAPTPYGAPPAPPYGAPPPPPPPGAGQYGAPQYGAPPPPPYGTVPHAGSPYGAHGMAYGQVPPGMYFEPRTGLVLPEGVVLASVGRRIGAWFLSFGLVIATLVIGWVIWGLIAWSRGTSPALQVLGMRCWRPQEARPAGFGWMALRDVVGGIVQGVLLGIGGLVSFVMFLANQDNRSLSDVIGGTVVVYDPNKVLDRY